MKIEQPPMGVEIIGRIPSLGVVFQSVCPKSADFRDAVQS